MRRKILLALSLFFVLTLLFSAQFTHTVQAEEGNPLTTPVTNPVTGPVTGPVTSPAALFTISGNVTYRFWHLFKHGMERIMPAAGVTVKAVSLWGHTTVTTTTDANGHYVLNPGKKGLYRVTVSGGKAQMYAPFFRVVEDKRPRGVHDVDFQGVLFNF